VVFYPEKTRRKLFRFPVAGVVFCRFLQEAHRGCVNLKGRFPEWHLLEMGIEMMFT
jgi:hypothetical protein